MASIRTLIYFICAGLLLTLPGEALNNIIINYSTSGLPGFLKAAKIDTVLLVIIFFAWGLISPKLNRLTMSVPFFYIFWGTFGLMVEWIFLNHAPWANKDANQLAMFTYWGSIFLAPYVLILAGHASRKFKKYLWAYLSLSPVIYIGTAIILSQKYYAQGILLSIDIFAWSLIALNLFYIVYYKGLLRHREGYISSGIFGKVIKQ